MSETKKPFQLTADEYADICRMFEDHDEAQNDFDNAESEVRSAIGTYNDAHEAVLSSAQAINAWLSERVNRFTERFDERPVSWQLSERGRNVRAWICKMEEALSDAEEVESKLDDISLPSEPDIISVGLDHDIEIEPQASSEAAA